MDSIKRVILGDMSAVRHKGVSYLNQNYFWPVSSKEFNSFSDLLHKSYVDLIIDIDNEILFDLALVELSFVNNLLNVFHYNYVNEYAMDNNIDFVYGQELEGFIDPDWEKIGKFYSGLNFPFGKVKRVVRRFIKNIVFNKHLPISLVLKGVFTKDKVISIGSMDSFKLEFIKKKGVFVSHYDYVDLIVNRRDVDLSSAKKYSSFFKKHIIERYIEYTKKNNTLFTKNIPFNKIKKSWSNRFYDLSKLYLLAFDFDKDVREVLVSDMATPYHKLLTLAFQRSGKNVYCFHHGNEAGFSVQMLNHETTISHCNKLVVPTNGIKESYKKLYSASPIEKRIGTQYLSLNSNFYSDLLSKHTKSNKSNESNIRKVMIIGYPMNPIRYTSENSLFFYSILDLEFRLITSLKKEGYYVIYKAHPEQSTKIYGEFNNLVDEILIQPFEDVWEKSDVLLFTYTSTTTFGYALTTNLPIVLVDSAKEFREKDERQKMSSRVKNVDATLDSDMRICFDLNSLLKAINNNSYNFSYVEEKLGYRI